MNILNTESKWNIVNEILKQKYPELTNIDLKLVEGEEKSIICESRINQNFPEKK